MTRRTSTASLEQVITSRLERRGKRVYGPPKGQYATLFIDDLHIAQGQEYATPDSSSRSSPYSVELLRQCLDHGTWHSTDDLMPNHIVDTSFVTALRTFEPVSLSNPNSTHRDRIPPSLNRVLRRFALLAVADLDTESIQNIFAGLVRVCMFDGQHQTIALVPGEDEDVALIRVMRLGLPKLLAGIASQLTSDLGPACLRNRIRFNIGDIFKVFQGLLLSSDSKLRPREFMMMVHHECIRVFQDRLTAEPLIKQFKDVIDDQTSCWLREYLSLSIAVHSDSETAAADQVVAQQPIIAPESFLLQGNKEPLFGETALFSVEQALIRAKKSGSVRTIGSEDINLPQESTAESTAESAAGSPDTAYSRIKSITEFSKNLAKVVPQVELSLPLLARYLLRVVRILRCNPAHAIIAGTPGVLSTGVTAAAIRLLGWKTVDMEPSGPGFLYSDWTEHLSAWIDDCGIRQRKVVVTCTLQPTTDSIVIDNQNRILEDISRFMTSGFIPGIISRTDLNEKIESMRINNQSSLLAVSREILLYAMLERIRFNLKFILHVCPSTERKPNRDTTFCAFDVDYLTRCFPAIAEQCTVMHVSDWTDTDVQTLVRTLVVDEIRAEPSAFFKPSTEPVLESGADTSPEGSLRPVSPIQSRTASRRPSQMQRPDSASTTVTPAVDRPVSPTAEVVTPVIQSNVQVRGTLSRTNSRASARPLTPDERKSNAGLLISYFYLSAKKVAERYAAESGSPVQITPTDLMFFVGTYNSLLKDKYDELQRQRRECSVALDKLALATQSLSRLALSQGEYKGKLQYKELQKAELLANIDKSQFNKRERERIIEDQENQVKEQSEKVREAREAANAQTNESRIAVDNARGSILALKPRDLDEIKNMKNPAASIRLIVTFVCIILNVRLKKAKDFIIPVEEYTDITAKIFGTFENFLAALHSVQLELIPAEAIKRIEYLVELQVSAGGTVETGNAVCKLLLTWVRAVMAFHRVYHQSIATEASLQDAERELTAIQNDIRERRVELDSLEDRINDARAELNRLITDAKTLEDAIEDTQKTTERAHTLLAGMNEERPRWETVVDTFELNLSCLRGTTLLATGVFCFLPAFPAVYREALLREWQTFLNVQEVQFQTNITIDQFIMNNLAVKELTLCGLPSDKFSCETGVVIFKAASNSRFPLVVDPNGIVVSWLKKLESQSKKEVDPRELLKDSTKPAGGSVQTRVQRSRATNEHGKEKDKEKPVSHIRFETGEPLRQMVTAAATHGHLLIVENLNKEILFLLDGLIKFRKEQILRKLLRVSDLPIDRAVIGCDLVVVHCEFRMVIVVESISQIELPILDSVTFVDLSLTVEALQEELLNHLLNAERPEDRTEKESFGRRHLDLQKALARTQKDVVSLTASCQTPNILDDRTLVEKLDDLCKILLDLKKRLATHRHSSNNLGRARALDELRSSLRPLLENLSMLYFSLVTLSSRYPSYSFSMRWFIHQLNKVTASVLQPNESAARNGEDVVNNLIGRQNMIRFIELVTYNMFSRVHSSCMANHRFTFGVIFLIVVIKSKRDIDPMKVKYLLTGTFQDAPLPLASLADVSDSASSSAASEDESKTAKDPARVPPQLAPFISIKSYTEFMELSTHRDFESIHVDLMKVVDMWRPFLEHPHPLKEPLPGQWDSLDDFSRLLLIRALRPDALEQTLKDMMARYLGERFSEPFELPLQSILREASNLTPVLLTVEPGVAYLKRLERLAEMEGRKLIKLTVGSQNRLTVEKSVKNALGSGAWVLVENIHGSLDPFWRTAFERLLLEDITPETANDDFRLILAMDATVCEKTIPSTVPLSVVRNCPRFCFNANVNNIADGIIQAYDNDIDGESLDNNESNAGPTRRVVFALCFLHNLLVRRQQVYEQFGFMNRLKLSDLDLPLMLQDVMDILRDFPEPPFDLLRQIFIQVQYGSKAESTYDRETITSLTLDILKDQILTDSTLLDLESYPLPLSTRKTKEGALAVLDQYPRPEPVQVFSLHDRVDCWIKKQRSYTLCGVLAEVYAIDKVSAHGQVTSANQRRFDVLESTVYHLVQLIPESIPQRLVQVENNRLKVRSNSSSSLISDASSIQGAVRHTESSDILQSVYEKEKQSYSNLLAVVGSDLKRLVGYLFDPLTADHDLDQVIDAIVEGRVPRKWIRCSFVGSSLILSTWVVELRRRLDFLSQWESHQTEVAFPLTQLFNPIHLFTAITRQYARKLRVPIDQVYLEGTVLAKRLRDPPRDGILVRDLNLHFAKWDSKAASIVELAPDQLSSELPPVFIQPYIVENAAVSEDIKLVGNDRNVHCITVSGNYSSMIRKPNSTPVQPQGMLYYSCPVMFGAPVNWEESRFSGPGVIKHHQLRASYDEQIAPEPTHSFEVVFRLPSRFPDHFWIKKGVKLSTQPLVL
eukprot:GILJ01006363.1.p1 GENE.GILJ01006363.1~~GILJ01006363.1.p1  ORF type:complete len:2568 (+),score=501.21 GILJ01006363.1:475-7704(+)